LLNKVCEHDNICVNFDILSAFFSAMLMLFLVSMLDSLNIFFYLIVIFCIVRILHSYILKCNEMHLESVGGFYYHILLFLHFSAEPRHYQGETTTRTNIHSHPYNKTDQMH
jgi:hypothetical protein